MLTYFIVLVVACLTALMVPYDWAAVWDAMLRSLGASNAPVRMITKSKDASRAFVTGDFTEAGLTDDVSDLSPSQIVALYDWLTFYQKDYTPVGRAEGYFYSADGEPTEALRQVEVALEQGLQLKAQAQAHSVQYPPCNTEWSSAGGRVWCSTQSGGVKREWVGVPRKLFSPGSSRSRCVCLQQELSRSDNPNLQEYSGCPAEAESCFVREH
ncbi:neuferricin isoform X3 [Alosa alosa]|uniref:neuferricin isoform X3 n=1 Tax=Alosa alosa TaxID=278164 RepID=UPI002015411F|nr:neuferricin isoform X3 [Alosa alosa]